MNTDIERIIQQIDNANLRRVAPSQIKETLDSLTSQIQIDAVPVEQRVILATHILRVLTREQRMELAKLLIMEQVIEQRFLLSHWSTVTAQSSMIDTGYIAQHLVSLRTQISGQGMRGKGDDLSDGSEVKSANFLDSLDRNGATAPRWNFTAITQEIMERFLEYSSIYLLSIDHNPQNDTRIRIWHINIREHTILRERYILWMNQKGYPKFADTNNKPSVNFQLFPPADRTNQSYARHGNNRANGFPALRIPLQDTPGGELIFEAIIHDSDVNITTF